MSGCGVCLLFDGETAEVFTQVDRKARRNYKCCECERPIAQGTVHQVCNVLCDGEWSTYRTCLVCAEIRKAFCCEGEVVGGVFWAEMADYGFPEITKSGDCLSRLTTAEAKRYFAQRYREWREAHVG